MGLQETVHVLVHQKPAIVLGMYQQAYLKDPLTVKMSTDMTSSPCIASCPATRQISHLRNEARNSSALHPHWPVQFAL